MGRDAEGVHNLLHDDTPVLKQRGVGLHDTVAPCTASSLRFVQSSAQGGGHFSHFPRSSPLLRKQPVCHRPDLEYSPDIREDPGKLLRLYANMLSF